MDSAPIDACLYLIARRVSSLDAQSCLRGSKLSDVAISNGRTGRTVSDSNQFNPSVEVQDFEYRMGNPSNWRLNERLEGYGIWSCRLDGMMVGRSSAESRHVQGCLGGKPCFGHCVLASAYPPEAAAFLWIPRRRGERKLELGNEIRRPGLSFGRMGFVYWSIGGTIDGCLCGPRLNF